MKLVSRSSHSFEQHCAVTTSLSVFLFSKQSLHLPSLHAKSSLLLFHILSISFWWSLQQFRLVQGICEPVRWFYLLSLGSCLLHCDLCVLQVVWWLQWSSFQLEYVLIKSSFCHCPPQNDWQSSIGSACSQVASWHEYDLFSFIASSLVCSPRSLSDESLKEMQLFQVPIGELVLGDIVRFTSGDVVPAGKFPSSCASFW